MAGVPERSLTLFIILLQYEKEHCFISFVNASVILIVMIYLRILKKYHLWISLFQKTNDTKVRGYRPINYHKSHVLPHIVLMNVMFIFITVYSVLSQFTNDYLNWFYLLALWKWSEIRTHCNSLTICCPEPPNCNLYITNTHRKLIKMTQGATTYMLIDISVLIICDVNLQISKQYMPKKNRVRQEVAIKLENLDTKYTLEVNYNFCHCFFVFRLF